MQRIQDRSINRDAVKALVLLHGQTKAAKLAGMNLNTVLSLAKRHGWTKHQQVTVTAKNDSAIICNRPATDVLVNVLTQARENSTLGLARFAEKAAKQASSSKNPLEIARKVRDVAAVHNTLWPAERHTEIIQASILLGKAQVRDDDENAS